MIPYFNWDNPTFTEGHSDFWGSRDTNWDDANYMDYKNYITKGYDVNAKHYDGYGLLNITVCCNDIPSTQLLLEHGSDINLQNVNGITALHQATWVQNTTLMKLLLSQGADPNISTTEGATPLHDTCHFTNTECVHLLLQYGADDTLRDHLGRTSLDLAKETKNQPIIDILENQKGGCTKRAK